MGRLEHLVSDKVEGILTNSSVIAARLAILLAQRVVCGLEMTGLGKVADGLVLYSERVGLMVWMMGVDGIFELGD